MQLYYAALAAAAGDYPLGAVGDYPLANLSITSHPVGNGWETMTTLNIEGTSTVAGVYAHRH